MTAEEAAAIELPESAPAPRLCQLVKWPFFEGYGFSLHTEKSRPGQHVGKIDAASPAEKAGLRDGDRIVEVNGAPVSGWTHTQVVEGIRAAGERVSLLVVTDDEHEFYSSRGISISAQLSNVVTRSAELKKDGEEEGTDNADQEESSAQPEENGVDHSDKADDQAEPATGAVEVTAEAADVSEEKLTEESKDEDTQVAPTDVEKQSELDPATLKDTSATESAADKVENSDKAPECSPAVEATHEAEDKDDGVDETDEDNTVQPEKQSVTSCVEQADSPTRKTPPPPPMRNGSMLSSPQHAVEVEAPAESVEEAAEKLSSEEEPSVETLLEEEQLNVEGKSDEAVSEAAEQAVVEPTCATEAAETPADQPTPKKEEKVGEEEHAITPETVTPKPSVKDTSFESAQENGPSSPGAVTSPEAYDINELNGSPAREARTETPETVTPPAGSPEPAPPAEPELTSAPPAPVEDWKNLSVAEMRARLKSKKRHDPRNDNLSFKQRHEIIQNM